MRDNQWQTTPLAFHSIFKASLRGYSSSSHRQRWKHLHSCPELSGFSRGHLELDRGRLLHLNLLSKQFSGKLQRWTHRSYRFSPTHPVGSMWYVTMGDIHAADSQPCRRSGYWVRQCGATGPAPRVVALPSLNQGLALAPACFRQYRFRRKWAQMLLWQCCHHVPWCGFWLLCQFL